MFVFNILVPLLLGVLSYVRTLQIYFEVGTKKRGFQYAIFICFVVNGVLQVISYGFFGAAIKKVRNFINKEGFCGKLNGNSFMLHALCFSLYLASGIVLCV